MFDKAEHSMAETPSRVDLRKFVPSVTKVTSELETEMGASALIVTKERRIVSVASVTETVWTDVPPLPTRDWGSGEAVWFAPH
jgi:hypothetical protein